MRCSASDRLSLSQRIRTGVFRPADVQPSHHKLSRTYVADEMPTIVLVHCISSPPSFPPLSPLPKAWFPSKAFAPHPPKKARSCLPSAARLLSVHATLC